MFFTSNHYRWPIARPQHAPCTLERSLYKVCNKGGVLSIIMLTSGIIGNGVAI